MMNVFRSICTAAAVVSLASGIAVAQNQVVQQVQIVQPANGNAFTVRAGASTVQQNITWPITLPTVGQFLKVSAVSGSNITLEWGAGGGGGGGSTVPLVASRTTDVAVAEAPTYSDVLTVAGIANTSYRIYAEISVGNINPNAQDLDLDWTLPAGATLDYVWVNTGSGASDTGTDPDLIPLTGDNQRIVLAGRVTLVGTAGNIVIRARRAAGTTALPIVQGSYVTYTP